MQLNKLSSIQTPKYKDNYKDNKKEKTLIKMAWTCIGERVVTMYEPFNGPCDVNGVDINFRIYKHRGDLFKICMK